MISGIAICNVCLKPCKVVATPDFKIESKCCKATVVHKNARITLVTEGSSWRF